MTDVPNTWPLNGHAPGNYMCQCVSCKQQFQGDKRAYQCLECAVKQVQSLLAALLSERERRTAQGVTWQPIDTAPKDEEFIGRCAPGYKGFSCFWNGEAFVHYDSDEGMIYYPIKEWRPFPEGSPSLSTSAGGDERG